MQAELLRTLLAKETRKLQSPCYHKFQRALQSKRNICRYHNAKRNPVGYIKANGVLENKTNPKTGMLEKDTPSKVQKEKRHFFFSNPRKERGLQITTTASHTSPLVVILSAKDAPNLLDGDLSHFRCRVIAHS